MKDMPFVIRNDQRKYKTSPCTSLDTQSIGFTQHCNAFCCNPNKILFAAISAMSERLFMVALPICGKIKQLGRESNGEDKGKGSGSVTSKPAANIFWFFRALYKAF